MANAPGCWEHVSLVWDELKATKSNKHSIAAVWLDIANASGSLSHRQIFYSLKRCGINPGWIDFPKSFSNGL